MEEFKVLTVRDLDFKDDQGQRVAGYQLWLCGQSKEPGWNGWEVLKVWIPYGHELEPIVADLRHDDSVIVEFNRRGKPRSIALVVA